MCFCCSKIWKRSLTCSKYITNRVLSLLTLRFSDTHYCIKIPLNSWVLQKVLKTELMSVSSTGHPPEQPSFKRWKQGWLIHEQWQVKIQYEREICPRWLKSQAVPEDSLQISFVLIYKFTCKLSGYLVSSQMLLKNRLFKLSQGYQVLPWTIINKWLTELLQKELLET